MVAKHNKSSSATARGNSKSATKLSAGTSRRLRQTARNRRLAEEARQQSPQMIQAQKDEKTVVQATERTGFLIDTLGNGELARLLGVSNRHPSQWRNGQKKPSLEVARQLVNLDAIMPMALQIWPAAVIVDWLSGTNDYLDGARPIDALRERGATVVIRALNVAMV